MLHSKFSDEPEKLSLYFIAISLFVSDWYE